MRSKDFEEQLLLEHLDSVTSAEVRRAAEVLIRYAEAREDVAGKPSHHGVIRTYRYNLGNTFPFAFIFNKESLLFYVRKPALAWPTTRPTVDSISDLAGAQRRLTNGGEFTIPIHNELQADRINTLIDAILSAHSVEEARVIENSGGEMLEIIRRPAALVRQGQLRLYTTSIQAKHLLAPGFYDIERLDPTNAHDKGFQRVLNTARAKRLADYVLAGEEHRDAFLPTSIFLATDKELAFDSATNMLEIDAAKAGSFSVVDGQHRLEGLRLAAQKNGAVGTFEVPVNIAVGLSKIAQMCHFLIVNTTQKSVDKSVEQRLIARLTDMVVSEDVPTLPRWIRRVVESGDDANALRLIDFLNTVPDSPWQGKIAIPNQPSSDTSVAQKSFVVAIKKYVLAASNPLPIWPESQQEKVFLNYWRALADELGSGDEETVLFKSIGVDLFCRFSGTLFNKLQNLNDFKVATFREHLRRTFDNMEGEYAGLGSPDWWLSGSGPAGGINAAALGKINQELSKALHRSDSHKDPVM